MKTRFVNPMRRLMPLWAGIIGVLLCVAAVDKIVSAEIYQPQPSIVYSASYKATTGTANTTETSTFSTIASPKPESAEVPIFDPGGKKGQEIVDTLVPAESTFTPPKISVSTTIPIQQPELISSELFEVDLTTLGNPIVEVDTPLVQQPAPEPLCEGVANTWKPGTAHNVLVWTDLICDAFPSSEWAKALCVVSWESEGNPTGSHLEESGDISVGLFQVNSDNLAGNNQIEGLRDWLDLYNGGNKYSVKEAVDLLMQPEWNVLAAHDIWVANGWRYPWAAQSKRCGL